MPFGLVSVLIPAYNEADSLEELFRRTDAALRSMNQPYEFLVINDGSKDATEQVITRLRATHPQVGMVSHARNHGKSMGLMQGLARIKGDVVITMDADLQDEPEEIPRFLAAIESGYDLVGGWRHKRQDPMAKRLVSWVYNSIVKAITGHEFKDINCGFKAYTAAVAKRLELTGDMHRLIPAIAVSYGFRAAEIPISHQLRRYGQSRYRLLRHRGLLDLITFMVLRTTQVRPFHVMSEAGFALLSLSAAIFFGYWLLGLLGSGPLADLLRLGAMLLGSLLGLTGILCPMVGLLVECVTIYGQGANWRNSLVREYLPPEGTLPVQEQAPNA